MVVAACHTGHSEAGAISLEEAGTRTGRLIVIRGFDVASEERIRVLGARVVVWRQGGVRGSETGAGHVVAWGGGERGG